MSTIPESDTTTLGPGSMAAVDTTPENLPASTTASIQHPTTTTTAAVDSASNSRLMDLDYEGNLVELTLNFTDILDDLDDDKIVSQEVGEVKTKLIW